MVTHTTLRRILAFKITLTRALQGQMPRPISAAPRSLCVGGGIEGQNMIRRGKNPKKLPKMADFGHFFWGGGGGRASDGGMPHAPLMPPLKAVKSICM